MRVFFLLLSFVFLCHANVLKSEIQEEWQRFMDAHKKVYKDESEREFRFKIFEENLKKIMKHNKEYEEGKTTYTMAMNKFGDMLESEVKDKFASLKPRESRSTIQTEFTAVGNATDEWDWREEGAVTPVKDEGMCNAAYAFAWTGHLEALYFYKTGHLVSMSEQYLMDCSWEYGNHGCSDGSLSNAADLILMNNGMYTEEDYPYHARDGNCPDPWMPMLPLKLNYWSQAYHRNEEELKEMVYDIGPVIVEINTNFEFQFYSGGIFKDPSCNPEVRNLAVLVVGYGVENGEDYWLVKNCWGENWGEQGYIKIARNYNNMCGAPEEIYHAKLE